jgi:energy-coupling factor transporter ATP-binding protein EcfA2
MDLNRNLSALIGENGSGKSNFLNGILLLKKTARIQRHPIDDDVPQSTCKMNGIFIIDECRLPFEAIIKYTTNENNIDQVITADQKWDFSEFVGNASQVTLPLSRLDDVKEFRKGKILGLKPEAFPEKTWDDLLSEAFMTIFDTILPSDPNQMKLIITLLERVYEYILGISYYSASQFTDPSKCPTYFELLNEKLLRRPLREWNEHQRFIVDLYFETKNPGGKFQEFLSIVGQDGIGLIDNVEFVEIKVPTNEYEVGLGGKVISKERNKLLVVPNFMIGSFKLSPNQLSEGTFKTLAIVFYLVTDKSKLLILEEPEVCVHHGLLASILELIKEASNEKQIIISTHSDFVLDELDPENVYIVRNDKKRGSLIKHIPKALSARDYKVLKDYLRESGNLGEYWRHGELEI